MHLCVYLCLYCHHVSCANWSVHNFASGRHPTWGWLLCVSPWRKRSGECSPPQESSYEALHQPPGTIIAHCQRNVLRTKKKKDTARNRINISNLQFLPQVSAAQCMFCPAEGKNIEVKLKTLSAEIITNIKGHHRHINTSTNSVS